MVKYGENTITSSPGSSSAIMVSPMPMQLEAVTNRFSREISMEKSSLYAFMTASISSESPLGSPYLVYPSRASEKAASIIRLSVMKSVSPMLMSITSL